MAMSGKLKLGLIAFVLVDVMLAVTFVSLYSVQSDRKFDEELRNLGITMYPEARVVHAFDLIDEKGENFGQTELIGRWNFVFFGFTSCPDICPLTMTELKQFYEGLEATERDLLRVVMVSVDPDRDNTETLGRYVNSFNDDFVGLTGSMDAISVVASQFFVAHSAPEATSHNNHTTTSEAADYLIEHSGHLAIVDPEGKFAAVMQSPMRDNDIAEAYRKLLANY